MKETLKLALEALYENTHYFMQGDPMTHQDERNDDTILVIKEALAQPDTFEQGRQEGLKQERALRTLSKLGQEIEAQPEERPCRSCDGTGERYTGIDEFPTAICKPCSGTGQIKTLAQPEPAATYTCGVCGVSMQMERPWVGLTDEEVRKICVNDWGINEWGGYEQARAIEAKLKEKNT